MLADTFNLADSNTFYDKVKTIFKYTNLFTVNNEYNNVVKH